jgi:hypothetical protein
MRDARTIVSLVGAFASIVSAGGAATVWTGQTMKVARPNSADWTPPQNQERLTNDVWITRGNALVIL